MIFGQKKSGILVLFGSMLYLACGCAHVQKNSNKVPLDLGALTPECSSDPRTVSLAKRISKIGIQYYVGVRPVEVEELGAALLRSYPGSILDGWSAQADHEDLEAMASRWNQQEEKGSAEAGGTDPLKPLRAGEIWRLSCSPARVERHGGRWYLGEYPVTGDQAAAYMGLAGYPELGAHFGSHSSRASLAGTVADVGEITGASVLGVVWMSGLGLRPWYEGLYIVGGAVVASIALEGYRYYMDHQASTYGDEYNRLIIR